MGLRAGRMRLVVHSTGSEARRTGFLCIGKRRASPPDNGLLDLATRNAKTRRMQNPPDVSPTDC